MKINFSEDPLYIADKELLAAIEIAFFLKRPLLLSGEPGTGKTDCAKFIARQLHRTNPETFKFAEPIRFDTKSTSQSNDLFYSYDAVAHFGDKSVPRLEKRSFISFNSLGLAILATRRPDNMSAGFQNSDNNTLLQNAPSGSVLLIDEIDKAPRDFPNDLLSELESNPYKFKIKELPEFEVKQDTSKPIFVVVTSNNEKGLPDAFLRRCVFYHIPYPRKDILFNIVKATLGGELPHLTEAIETFEILRNKPISKKPSTSELIDWVAALRQKDLLSDQLPNWTKADKEYQAQLLQTFGILAKTKNDIDQLNDIS